MQDDELLRYSRHILLDEIGIEGQDRLAAAHALVVGAGGLGSPVAMYLAAAGVGHITLIDPDTVDLTNLQRQTLHTTERVGLPKVASAAHALRELNPHVQVSALQMHADERTLPDLVQQADVVLDCTDNFKTRHAINIACVHHGKPLVSGAAIRWDGQISVFDTRTTHGPCYACAFPANEQPEETRCSTMGVFAPLVGIIGAMQAAEALKLLLQLQPSLAGRLLMLQGRAMEWTEVRLARQPHCVVCSGC
jgi:molybdopterin/thiamine biosynthesis adenylyltransferase